MKSTISSGHGKYVKGAGKYIDEVTEARKVVNRVSGILKEMNEPVNVYHDDVSKNKTANINNIVKQHNATNREKDISIHFNAYKETSEGMGVEVLYVTDTNKTFASNMSKAIADAGGLKNRGAKKRTNLGFLNGTAKGAILIEVCFVDSKKDVELYKKNFENICRAIAEQTSGRKYVPLNSGSTGKKIMFGVLAGSFEERKYAEKVEKELKALGYDAFLEAREVKS